MLDKDAVKNLDRGCCKKDCFFGADPGMEPGVLGSGYAFARLVKGVECWPCETRHFLGATQTKSSFF